MDNNPFPHVSVVTPVYNGQAYLEECIKSVLNQTYKNWEYIILNNCSTDRTLAIAEKYALQDNRIRVYSNDTLLPIMKNWNRALRHMSSESRYCKVVHADDCLMVECLSRMVDLAEANPTAGIVGSYSVWGNRLVSDGLPYDKSLFPGKTIGRLNLLNEIYTFWSPSALLIRSDLIREKKHFYNEAYLHADVMACYEILKRSDFAFVHQVLTFIRRHDESVTSKEAAPYNKIGLSNLDLLIRYGPEYLEKEEYEAHLKKKIEKYYGFLVRCVFNLRGKAFWSFQSEAFKKIGLRLMISKLVYKVIGAIIASPVKTLTTLGKSAKEALAGNS